MILDKIVEDKKIRLREHKKREPLEEVRQKAREIRGDGGKFFSAVKKPGLSIIAEFKRASPSLGEIHAPLDLRSRMEEYGDSADAVSCLTEEDHFSGGIDDLRQVRALTGLPILRKDFMIDEYQFYEAKAYGADAVLLIAAILDDKQMSDFYRLACELKLDVLVEVHNENELERALKAGAEIIGVNNRNLKDFSISLETTKRLSSMVPKEKALVAESGIVTDSDAKFLKECGADAFLVGRALMEAEHPKELVRRWKNL